jgi:hypothetical protein
VYRLWGGRWWVGGSEVESWVIEACLEVAGRRQQQEVGWFPR